MPEHVESIPLYRKRGDDYPMEFTLFDDEDPMEPVNILGFTFKLAVDPSDCPLDATNNVLNLTGSIVNDALGIFQFNPSVAEMNITPDTYYYEVAIVDGAGNNRTIVKSKFIIEQDVVK